MSNQLIEAMKKQQAEKHDQAFGAYVEFLQASLDSQLDAKSQTALTKTIEFLEFPIERVEADLHVLREARRLEGVVGGKSASYGRLTEARGELLAMQADWDAKLRAYREKEAAAVIRVNEAEFAHGIVMKAEDDLNRLRVDHFRLLRQEDPAALAKQYHIQCASRPHKAKRTTLGEIGVRNVEDFFVSPPVMSIEDKQFVPMEGQSREEMESLLALVRSIIEFDRTIPERTGKSMAQSVTATHTVALYVLPADKFNVAAPPVGAACVDWILESYDDRLMMLVQHPDQSGAEFDTMKKKLGKALTKRRKAEEREKRMAAAGVWRPEPEINKSEPDPLPVPFASFREPRFLV